MSDYQRKIDYEKPLNGILNRNLYKWRLNEAGKWEVIPGKEKSPDYLGRIFMDVPGIGRSLELCVAGHIRKSKKDGKPFLSVWAEWDKGERVRIQVDPKSLEAPVKVPEVDIPDEDLPF